MKSANPQQAEATKLKKKTEQIISLRTEIMKC